MVSLMPYFRIGSKVEVAGSDEGFLGSWYEAIVVKRGAKHCMVKYCNLLGDASDQPLVERHSMSLIRPLPPILPVEAYEEGDAVEAYDRDGWWVGTVCKVLPDDKCLVYFRESREEIEYHTSKMRLRQDWLNGIWIRVYERRNPTLEAFRKQGILGATPVKVLKSSFKASAKLAGRRKGLHDIEAELELENNQSDFPEAPRRKKLKASSSDYVAKDSDLPSPTIKKKLLLELVHRKQQLEKSDRASGGEDAAKLLHDPEHGKGSIPNLESPGAKPRKGLAPSEPIHCTLRSSQILAYSSVLRAFHLQGPGLTWQQEQLITELRCQLQIDNDVHIKELESLDGWDCRCHCPNCSRKVYGNASGRQCMQV